jgi:hypothetical protein
VVLYADLVGVDHVPHTPGRLWAWPIIVDSDFARNVLYWFVSERVLLKNLVFLENFFLKKFEQFRI